MKSQYTITHDGLNVDLVFEADEAWINHRDLMSHISEIIGLAECCNSFSLVIRNKDEEP